MNELREAAIEYAMKGWAVFPLRPKSKHPDGFLVPEGYRQASAFPSDCLYWWERSPDANIGIACHSSGLVVIDVDERAGGYETMFEWRQRFSKRYAPLPEGTATQLTPSGGMHYVFKHPGVPLKGQLGPGVDIKDHGYILAAPSIHPNHINGPPYMWEGEEDEPGPMPEAWVAALEVAKRTASTFDPSNEPLLQIPAEHYAKILTGREIINGWMQCPFHKEGQERTPSFKVDGPMWACFACEPLMDKQVMGGNLLDLAGMLKNYGMPLRGSDLQIVKAEMERMFSAADVTT